MREEQGGQDRSVVSHDTIGSIMLRIFEKTKKCQLKKTKKYETYLKN